VTTVVSEDQPSHISRFTASCQSAQWSAQLCWFTLLRNDSHLHVITRSVVQNTCSQSNQLKFKITSKMKPAMLI